MEPLQDAILAAAVKIKAIDRHWALGYYLAIGEVIVQEVFHGKFLSTDSEAPSLGELAAIDGMPSRVVLWRAVRVCELRTRFPELLAMRHVGMSHVRHLLTLPEGRQRDLLRIIETDHWSEVRVQEVVKQLRRDSAHESSQLPASSQSWAKKLAKEWARLAELELQLESTSSMNEREISRVLALVDDIREVLRKLEARLSGQSLGPGS